MSQNDKVCVEEIPQENILVELTKVFLTEFNLKGPNYTDTPARVTRLWQRFFSTPEPKLTAFPLEGKPGLIFIKNHIAWSFCPHHLLPVRYEFKIGYIPNKQVLGLSKLGRIADYVCTKLPLQEEAAYLVVKHIEEAIEPKGAGCVIKGEHLCMQMRGIQSTHVSAHSSHMSGIFLLSESARNEFLTL